MDARGATLPRGVAAATAALCACALLAAFGAAAADAGLGGLWGARRTFVPTAHGPLVVRREGADFTADIAGHLVPVTVEGDRLSFSLPGGAGAFAGVRAGGEIRGHWFPPPAVAAGGGRFIYASPVVLRRAGADRWTGDVEPFEDAFTLYLSVTPRADGSFGAFLRNPERNHGLFVGIEGLVREGDDVLLTGNEPGAVLVRGRYDAEEDVISLPFPGRGGTYDFRREREDSRFHARGARPQRYAYRPPPALDDGWETGTLEDVDIDRPAIERFVQMILDTPIHSVQAPEVHAILVARHGRLVLEEYFHGEHRDKLHDTRSAAKSLTTTIVGAAMHAGAPLAPSTRVYDAMYGGAPPADLDPRKRGMTLEHLLTMSSGYHCNDGDPAAPGNENFMLDESGASDYYAFTLAVPMESEPGTRAVYCSIAPNLALGVVGRVMNESPLSVFDRLLAQPLGIERYGWFLDPAHNPYGGGGVHMRPRDFMKMGQLMLDGGTWRGRRVLDRAFVERASARLYHLNGIYYGYLWWGIDFPYRDRTVAASFAGGNGGQAVIVVPALDLVVATFGGNYGSRVAMTVQQEYTPDYILPAVRESKNDREPVVTRDYVTPYGRSEPRGPVATSP